MPDHLTPEQRRHAMSRVKLKDGPLEVIIRSALHKRGYRFKKHVKELPGNPDVVFVREKIAVFIDGDFWHGYKFSTWEHKLSDFWREKIATNIVRDLRNFRKLREMGWKIIRIWQHQIKRDVNLCIERIVKAIEQARLLDK